MCKKITCWCRLFPKPCLKIDRVNKHILFSVEYVSYLGQCLNLFMRIQGKSFDGWILPPITEDSRWLLQTTMRGWCASPDARLDGWTDRVGGGAHPLWAACPNLSQIRTNHTRKVHSSIKAHSLCLSMLQSTEKKETMHLMLSKCHFIWARNWNKSYLKLAARRNHPIAIKCVKENSFWGNSHRLLCNSPLWSELTMFCCHSITYVPLSSIKL